MTHWILRSVLSKRAFAVSARQYSDFSHVVIGGGAVGTAIASELQQTDSNNVALIEQHEMLGMETTSRNSEVIHAGLYYPADSLKAKLCIRGKDLIYSRLDPLVVPYQKCGKWVVAQTEEESQYLEKLMDTAKALDVPVNYISKDAANKVHPLIRAEHGAVESPTTGIISAHELVLYYNAGFENAGGTLALHTKVTDIEYEQPLNRYVVHCKEGTTGEEFTFTTDNLINSAGLHAPRISNMLLPEERRVNSYFAKGSYFSFAPETPIPTRKITSKLIYPCPKANASGLGTHLTFDLGGQIRFGPDLEWLTETEAEALNYDVSSKSLEPALEAIRSYFPQVELGDLQPSYSGIRPKLVSQEDNKKKFLDFYIRKEDGFPGFVNLLAIESPGLTASYAIAEYVKDLYYS
ncbi:hypothetical protein PUMCH_003264 [Australozyma saopauloensis]|uniref:L-2-hydroxyglutarate dehydrogenase, mitochondrial n=1 Tax=Australozyma saopauloensis TaxID=291208 RepID=A0AAX4HC70_9ASCO|nr:hypothetical protein PUMCH_003264 [[Candida] saopauloensis]